MIIIIDNYDSFTYNLYQMLAQHADVRVFRNDKVSLTDIEQLNPAGIVLSPGPGKPEDAGICQEIIQQFSGKIPLLGICLGHQAIVTALGGKVIEHDEIVHGKTSRIYHLKSDLFSKVDNFFNAGRYHSLTADIESIPAVLRINAICERNSVMAVEHVEHPTYGIQFHPESILTPCGDSILKRFIDICYRGKADVNSTVNQAHAA